MKQSGTKKGVLLGVFFLSMAMCIAVIAVQGTDVAPTSVLTARRTVPGLYDYYTASLSRNTTACSSSVSECITSTTCIPVYPFKAGVIQFASGAAEAFSGTIGSVSFSVKGAAKIDATTAQMSALKMIPLHANAGLADSDLVTGVTNTDELGSYLIPLAGLRRIAVQVQSATNLEATLTFYLSLY